MSKPKIIAFYLPQFHPTPDNDKWWGKGFTEWTNVAKAKPLFKGHYQPHIPADLGFYDLRLPETREAQAELAKEAGIDGFCYWNYWFGNGKEELELPLNEVLTSKKPDFPFMLCWANESWHKKLWNKDGGGSSKELLIEQTYPGEEDIINHFYSRLKAFKDKRYIKYNNKPLFMIYEWLDYPDVSNFISVWNKLAKKEGFDGIYFIAHVKWNITEANKLRAETLGFDAINIVRIWTAVNEITSFRERAFRFLKKRIFKIPGKVEYKNIYPHLFSNFDLQDNVFPTLAPNWDHSPRSGAAGILYHNSTPKLFKKHCIDVLSKVKSKNDPNFVFIRAWNEWGEGNHMEPDLKYGKGYIKSLREAITEIFNS